MTWKKVNDKMKTFFAYLIPFAHPHNYQIRLIWTDKTEIKHNNKNNKGWLK